MKVKLINGQKIYIEWQHSNPDGTRCSIYDKEFEKDTGFLRNDIYSALSKVSPKDQFCRAIGRKISLQKVLKKAIYCMEDRTIIWNTYHSLFPYKKK